MKDNSNLWLGIRKSLKLYEQMLKGVCIQYQLTGIEADVISFLQHNPGKDTAMDMVELRLLSKGSISKAVEGLIQKSSIWSFYQMLNLYWIVLKRFSKDSGKSSLVDLQPKS